MFFAKENSREVNNDSRRDYQKLRTILDAIGGLLQNEGLHEGQSRWLRVIIFLPKSGNFKPVNI